jgi:F-type H+-transporting ATPase subunit b
MRGRASDEVSGTLQDANDELKVQSDSIAPTLNASVETLSQTLASRVLGVSGSNSTGSVSASTV